MYIYVYPLSLPCQFSVLCMVFFCRSLLRAHSMSIPVSMLWLVTTNGCFKLMKRKQKKKRCGAVYLYWALHDYDYVNTWYPHLEAICSPIRFLRSNGQITLAGWLNIFVQKCSNSSCQISICFACSCCLANFHAHAFIVYLFSGLSTAEG